MYKSTVPEYTDTAEVSPHTRPLFAKETRTIAALAQKSDLKKRIQALILLKGLTQQCIAAKMGLTEAALSHKINGKTAFTLPEAVLLAKILSEDFRDIFFR